MGAVGAVVGAIPVVLAAIGTVTLSTRSCPDPFVAALQLVLPWTALASAVVAIVAAVAGAAPLATAAAISSTGAAIVLVPRLRRTARPGRAGDGPRCSIALANLYLDNAEADEAARQLIEQAPDVIVMTELTDELVAAFDRQAAGVYRRRVHPDPLEGEYEPGIFVADHLDVVDTSIGSVGPLRTVEATVVVGGRPLRILTVHPVAPTGRADFARWRAQLRALRDHLSISDGATVVLGDLNAGTLQVPYEDVVRRTRFRDAHDVFGVGLHPSWGIAPGLPRWVPTLVARLDHLLVSPEITVCRLDDLDPVGSDHRPFVATLAVGEP